MKLIKPQPFRQVITLGVLAGMRASSAPLIANRFLSYYYSPNLSKSPLRFLESRWFGIAIRVMAAGELIADKLPATPDRTSVPGITGRCISGALTGAGIYKASGNNAVNGALLGLVAALGATFGSYALRKTIAERFDILDPLIGAAEDVTVIAAGLVIGSY